MNEIEEKFLSALDSIIEDGDFIIDTVEYKGYVFSITYEEVGCIDEGDRANG